MNSASGSVGIAGSEGESLSSIGSRKETVRGIQCCRAAAICCCRGDAWISCSTSFAASYLSSKAKLASQYPGLKLIQSLGFQV